MLFQRGSIVCLLAIWTAAVWARNVFQDDDALRVAVRDAWIPNIPSIEPAFGLRHFPRQTSCAGRSKLCNDTECCPREAKCCVGGGCCPSDHTCVQGGGCCPVGDVCPPPGTTLSAGPTEGPTIDPASSTSTRTATTNNTSVASTTSTPNTSISTTGTSTSTFPAATGGAPSKYIYPPICLLFTGIASFLSQNVF